MPIFLLVQSGARQPRPGGGPEDGMRLWTWFREVGMSDKQFWYGFLDAGSKSSPVLVDGRLDTGNPKTQFIEILSTHKPLNNQSGCFVRESI